MKNNQTNPESTPEFSTHWTLPVPESAYRITVEELETGETDTFETACASIVSVKKFNHEGYAICKGKACIKAPFYYYLALEQALKNMADEVINNLSKDCGTQAMEGK